MRQLKNLAVDDDFSGSWCNSNAVTSSVMEAVSFITPELENFFIKTTIESMFGIKDTALKERCLSFIREEAAHTTAHKKLNTALLEYLVIPPPTIGIFHAFLMSIKKHVTLSCRLLFVVVLEHFSTVLSKRFLTLHKNWVMGSNYAKALFTGHAVEEMGHRSVIFDLWHQREPSNRIKKFLVVTLILLFGIAYVLATSSWILYQKNGRNIKKTLRDVIIYICRKHQFSSGLDLLRELYQFVGKDFHPDLFIE